MHYSVNYLTHLFLKVATLSKSISQIENSMVCYDALAEYVFYTRRSHSCWFGFEPATAISGDLSHETKFSRLPGKLTAKSFPPLQIGTQDHTVSTQSHTNLSLYACNRKDLLCWSKPINHKLEPIHICIPCQALSMSLRGSR